MKEEGNIKVINNMSINRKRKNNIVMEVEMEQR